MRILQIKKITSLIVMSLITLSAQAADFRDAEWGMTMAEVKSLHQGEIPANQRQAMVNYESKLAGLDVLIFYRFDALGRLHQAGYEAIAEHSDRNNYLDDYNHLNKLLQKRYPDAGQPTQVWTNRLFEDKPDNWGRAVASGHMTYQWSYESGRSRITHELSNDKRRRIVHILLYEAIADAADTDILDEL
ncbi:MAG: hypothetical protein ACFHXK_18120 [bacterium]